MSDTTFNVTIRATSIVVYPAQEAMILLQPLLLQHEYEDEYQQTVNVLGYMYDEKYDKLYLHKGIDIEYLKRLLKRCEIKYDPYHPYQEMKYEFEEVFPPRSEDQKDYIRFITGEDPYSSNLNDSQIFLVAKTGSGKMEPVTNKIPTPTPNGFTYMGDLKVGDYVFDENGKPTKVLQIYEKGLQYVYEITFGDGRTARCGKDHLWEIYVDKHDTPVVVRTSDLMALRHRHNCSVRMCKPLQYPHVDTPLPPYTAGWRATNSNHKIPDVYLYNDPKSRWSLLQGLRDALYANMGRPIRYFSQSEELLQQVQWLIYSLGYTCLRCHNDIVLLKNKSNLPIQSIKKCDQEVCRCIKVENLSRLYLTENCIVTHNTYCAGYGIGINSMKTLIVMHRDNLRGQWVNSLFDLNGFPSKSVYELTSSKELEDIVKGNITLDYDIYLMTHATFRAACNRIQDTELISNITKNLKIGFKVIDEAHLEFKDTLLMDFLMNVKRNLYLTATDGRSSKDENTIFRHVFSNTTFYRKQNVDPSGHPTKWVEYITVDINTHVNPNIYRYRVNSGRGMSAVTYGKWVIAYDKKKRHFKACRDIIKQIYETNPDAKILIFLPLIELCQDCAYFLTMELDHDPEFEYSLTIRTVNSHNTKSENDRNKQSDVIITTIQSLGTGSDIKGVTDIINCTPIVSRIVVTQVLGRIRYINKPCHYYDIIDLSVQTDIFWWKSRRKTFKKLCTDCKHIAWDDGEDDHNATKGSD